MVQDSFFFFFNDTCVITLGQFLQSRDADMGLYNTQLTCHFPLPYCWRLTFISPSFLNPTLLPLPYTSKVGFILIQISSLKFLLCSAQHKMQAVLLFLFFP